MNTQKFYSNFTKSASTQPATDAPLFEWSRCEHEPMETLADETFLTGGLPADKISS
jgi:hypothetical protein